MNCIPNPLSSVKMFVYKIHNGVKQLRSRASGRIDLESVCDLTCITARRLAIILT